MHNHNRQKEYIRTADRNMLKLKAGESARQSVWRQNGERAMAERAAVKERALEEIVLFYEGLSGIPRTI